MQVVLSLDTGWLPGAWQAPHFTVFTIEILDQQMLDNALENVQDIQRAFQLLLGGTRIDPTVRGKGYSNLEADAQAAAQTLDDLFPDDCELTLRAGEFMQSETFPFWYMREFIPLGSSQRQKIERFISRVYKTIEGPDVVAKFQAGKAAWEQDSNPNKVVLVDKETNRKLLRRNKYTEFKWHISAGNVLNLLNGSQQRQQDMIAKNAATRNSPSAKQLYLKTTGKLRQQLPADTAAYLNKIKAELLETRDKSRKLPFSDWLIAPRFFSQNIVTVSIRPSNGAPPIHRKGTLIDLQNPRPSIQPSKGPAPIKNNPIDAKCPRQCVVQ